MASIGEYGLDINNGRDRQPERRRGLHVLLRAALDLQFTHDNMTNTAQLTPGGCPSGAAAAPRVIEHATAGFEPHAHTIAPFIHLMGTIGADGAVEVSSVARIDTRYLREGAVQTAYLAQHLDADGRILAEDALYTHADSGCCGDDDEPGKDCGCHDEPRTVTFKAMLRDTAPGASLRIVKRGNVLWERKAAEKPARLGGAKASLTKGGDLRAVRGGSRAADEEYANEERKAHGGGVGALDRGRWPDVAQRLTAGLRGRLGDAEHRLPLSSPSGKRALRAARARRLPDQPGRRPTSCRSRRVRRRCRNPLPGGGRARLRRSPHAPSGAARPATAGGAIGEEGCTSGRSTARRWRRGPDVVGRPRRAPDGTRLRLAVRDGRAGRRSHGDRSTWPAAEPAPIG